MKDERIDESKYIDKKIQFYKGCLLGGALGDALGYPIEFRKLNEIKAKYGEDGLDHLVLADNGKALFSDDTQMTLFAANGLVAGHDRGLTRGVGGDPYWHTYYALEDWLTTQGYEKPRKLPTTSWLLQVKELHALRAPGNTCLSSLQAKEPGSVSNPLNDSKGCGAVMRIAPVGLFYAAMNDTAGFLRMTAELGAITHGHRMSHLSCMFVADLIRHALRMTVYEVEDYQYPYEAVEVTLADLERYYGEWTSTAK
ncbi:MAG: ADP-ribosylglycohydrolase family protein, partial [Clostridia bacterium]|nr:ADP-ribosylglycohydrolase family protein [Clostridia bacterium]